MTYPRAFLRASALFVGLLLTLSCSMLESRSHRSKYRQVALGEPAARLVRVFGREADCAFRVEQFEVRYYLSPAYEAHGGCLSRRLDRRAWPELPREYEAAAFVISPDGSVIGRELIGEGQMERLEDASLPEGGMYVGITRENALR